MVIMISMKMDVIHWPDVHHLNFLNNLPPLFQFYLQILLKCTCKDNYFLRKTCTQLYRSQIMILHLLIFQRIKFKYSTQARLIISQAGIVQTTSRCNKAKLYSIITPHPPFHSATLKIQCIRLAFTNIIMHSSIIFIDQIILQYLSSKIGPPMQIKRTPAGKYNKVNQQKKFHLLTLIYKQKTPIREAALQVGINYLTAKTIVFFHKNHYKSYQFDLSSHPHSRPHNGHAPTPNATASVALPRKLSPASDKLNRPRARIEVVCSIGNVFSPSLKPKSFTEGQITRQFASRPTAFHEVNHTVHLPQADRPTHDWLFCPTAVDHFSIQKIGLLPMAFGSASEKKDFESLK